MRRIISISLAVLLSATLAHSQTNDAAGLDATISNFTARISTCLAGLSKNDLTKEEQDGNVFEVICLLGEYDDFIRSQPGDAVLKAEADAGLVLGVTSLRIAHAEHQLIASDYTNKQPAVSVLESALKNYELAFSGLKKIGNDPGIKAPVARIEGGLARVIVGLDNYAQWYRHDAFANPEGRELPNNKAPEARQLLGRIGREITDLPLLNEYSKSFKKQREGIKTGTVAEDAAGAMDAMIEGVKTLTLILAKDKGIFRAYFREYNNVAAPAMKLVGKKQRDIPQYSKKIAEWDKYYKPLKAWALYIDQEQEEAKK